MSVNEAAWILEEKGDLQVLPAPYPIPEQNEIVIKHLPSSPLVQNVFSKAYIDVPYPFILGNGVAGVVEEIVEAKRDTGVGRSTWWEQSGNTAFEDAAAIPFALLTAVAALHLKLGMGKPKSNCTGKALIWSASGSVGGYAVQYASSAGYDVVATASPQKFDYVRSLGASEVVDYKDEQVVARLRELGPYDFVMTASGDAKGATAISDILQPAGGKFVSTRPKNEEMHLAANVSLLYDFFSMTTQREENAAFTTWWYSHYLPMALAGGVTPTPLERRSGGLHGIKEACEDVIAGRSPKKLVLSP
ncbi:hypothetical protein V493_02565 [Pseudogymnoascus sp. VKM F-4281 (FW-2241)]|nr:hypothetical protein V493_02565 [Pseudogymnoascus sp. VKM F-4281 (FW-2241)]